MNPIETFLLFVASPSVLVFAIVEGVVLARRQFYDWKAFGVSTADLVIRIAVTVFIPYSLASPLVHWAVAHRLSSIHLDRGSWLFLFVGQEFCYYWYHRAAHRVRWFWANHAVHHSPNDLNLSAAFRIGFLGKISGATVFYVPLLALGFEPGTVFAVLSLNLLYQFWIHATWIPRLGWLEGIVNTPSAHRVHHATNPAYLDANFGGVLLVFDRLFGTYVAERDDMPCRYGVVPPMASDNLVEVEFSQWIGLLRDLAAAGSPRAFLGTLFGPPGWLPDPVARSGAASEG